MLASACGSGSSKTASFFQNDVGGSSMAIAGKVVLVTGGARGMGREYVRGFLRVIKEFSKPMLEQGRGSIISVSSGGYNASRPNSREMPYQSAKAALVTMTLYLSNELQPSNIAANVLLPGHTASTGTDEQEAIRSEMRARSTPAGGQTWRPMRVRAEHVVPLALFLADQDASGVTGQVINATTWNKE